MPPDLSRLRAVLVASAFALTLLWIEFLDELVFGAREAAWPLIRSDLGLTYLQVGVLLGLPALVASIIEVFIDILADVWQRRVLILGGGVFFIVELVMVARAQSFGALLLAFLIFYPASGAFVSLSQAALMDAEPERREQNMARWTFAGSLGVVAGPLLLGGMVTFGAGWRSTFLVCAVLSSLALALAWRYKYPAALLENAEPEMPKPGFVDGLIELLRALRSREVLRWLALLQFSDLMMDVLLGFLALYMVDVGQATPAQAGLAVAVWSGFGLLGDFLLIPLLEKVRGLAYLRYSALLEMALMAAFLLAPWLPLKLLLLALLGFFNSGWYAILQAQLYQTLPGRSGITLALNNLSGLAGSLLPLLLGWVAQRYNLNVTMWLLLAGPLALLIGLPKQLGLLRQQD